ncbi:MAG: hypothetical protein AAFP76_13830, partial [Bacteroidota bacterium]
MATQTENTDPVIFQKDPNLPEYMDFNVLRKEGLEHIGNLAGKIWTDHNVHDPGITILEALIYALMDLGYRTNLPFEELIAHKGNSEKENNFLTPLEVLTINPVTILDYRKLLLEIPGVRNAWLKVLDEESGIFIDQRTNQLKCDRVDPIEPPTTTIFHPEGAIEVIEGDDQCIAGETHVGIHLNGLYKVYIEKDSGLITNPQQEKDLVEEVRKLLSSHRNLCEDFFDICILDPLDFGFCVEVEILSGNRPEKIYADIYRALKAFIQPELTYYTLQELLENGKSIDEIFAGRPFAEESFGFVDTEELQSLELRDQFNLSDVYSLILSIDGVSKIKKVQIKGGTLVNLHSPFWKESSKIPKGAVPVFSAELTCIDLYTPDGLVVLDKNKIHKSFSFFRKFLLPQDSLDCQVPLGMTRDSLGDYETIQNEFPVVYGIGTDGLPESATLERNTQALQLKAYLMFYDQLLANYTAQLNNLRSLFSIEPEESKDQNGKKTYFSQLPSGVSQLDHLLKFYNEPGSISHGTSLALPVANNAQWDTAMAKLAEKPRTALTISGACEHDTDLLKLFTFSSASIRSIYMNLLVDSFYDEKYTVEIVQDRHGCLFVLKPALPNDILLVGSKRYPTKIEARNEAKNTAFLLSKKESYHLVTDTSETTDPDLHYFELVYNPVSYLDLIQELTEKDTEYLSRRKQFLDHLLARFGEEFTEYTLLQYQAKMDTKTLDQNRVNDQSKFINEFSEISRNRGRAFDYLEPSWNSANVSGFEQRVSLMAGINNYHRRNLCNFEVTPCFRLLLRDPNEATLFKSNRSYETKAELESAASKVLLQLRDAKSYVPLEKRLLGFKGDRMRRIFSRHAGYENIVPKKYNHRQLLRNRENQITVLSKNEKMSSARVALDRRDEFIKNINEKGRKVSEKKVAYRLLPLQKENYYLNAEALKPEIETLISWKWHLLNPDTNKKLSSEKAFEKNDEAWKDLIKEVHLETYLTKHDNGLRWSIAIHKSLIFEGLDFYPDAYRAIASWRGAKTLGASAKNYGIERDATTIRIVLRNEKKHVIARSNELPPANVNPEKYIERSIKLFNNRNAQPEYNTVPLKFGFQIPGKGALPSLQSYCVYDSEERALLELEQVFTYGASKTNYLRSGDEGNPEYNFIIRDDKGGFLAMPTELFETAVDRNKALNASIRHIKAKDAPVLVKEEPRRYVWSLQDDGKPCMESKREFTSKAKARADFDRAACREASKQSTELFEPHIYTFETEGVPVQFNYVYGGTDPQNSLDPVFISTETFRSIEDAKIAYANFVERLPAFSLKSFTKKDSPFAFGLVASDTSEPVVVQYKKGAKKSSLESAKELTTYISSIYTKEGTPRASFIKSAMAEFQDGRFEWRFYKKNSPIARSPYCCPTNTSAAGIKSIICDIVPPIDLRECPPKEVVVCPEKNPGKFHFRVCFRDNQHNDFILISYIGYDSYEEAKNAWELQWLDIVHIARNSTAFGPNGKISVDEIYKDPESRACDDSSFVAVVPETEKRRLAEAGKTIKEYYSTLAQMFPIYKVENETDEECHQHYTYRVVTAEKLIDTDCEFPYDDSFNGRLLWESTDCYRAINEVIAAYQRFYTLAGISNNCRVLCEKGCHYVGLVEVLVESLCEYDSESDAWDDAFGEYKNDCGECRPGGVREFIYAAEDCENYIPICENNYWSFKVVSPDYFVVDHKCYYNSEKERDIRLKDWVSWLQGIDWKNYITHQTFTASNPIPDFSFLTHLVAPQGDIQLNGDEICDWIHGLRDCLNSCDKNDQDTRSRKVKIVECLQEKFKNNKSLAGILKLVDFEISTLERIARYFPVYKTDTGYCFRLYWPGYEKLNPEKALQPCGCDGESEPDRGPCNEAYPFVSSNCFSCCEEALSAFEAFCELITSGRYSVECTSKSEHGPYAFQIIDKSKELGYHPQQYSCLQEVLDAIEITKACVDNTGMHLLEHILLRPKDDTECLNNKDQEKECCLLPICPDYCCKIDWRPDMDDDDPCADTHPDIIYYVPGSDPYSFWATLVLPAWDKRFRSLEKREAFEKFLYREVPALVGLHILWLSPRQMCKFEDAYRNWLAWKQDPSAPLCDSERLSPTCRLVQCIQDLESESPCPPVPGANGSCTCEEMPREDTDPCCLPPETEGSLFWGYCPPEPIPSDDPAGPVLLSRNPAVESVAEMEEAVAVKPAKKSVKRIKKKPAKNQLLAKIRQRKPKYEANIKELADEKMRKTKSYERALFFVQNVPTIPSYIQLVKFFDRYSLQKDNDKGFLEILRNASWHLFDALVLDEKASIGTQEIDQMKQHLLDLKDKGLSLKKLNTAW